jgi:antirestriction protein
MVKIYVANLAAYNAGHLIGKWLELPQDEETLKEEIQKIRNAFGYDAEIEIHDIEGITQRVADRYSILQLNDMLNKLEELNSEITIADFVELLSDYSSDSILETICNGDYAIYNVENDEELGEEVFSIFGEELPDHLLRYFDFESYGRDYFLNHEMKWLNDNKLIEFIR